MSEFKIAVTADLHYGITDREEIESMLTQIKSEGHDLIVVAGDSGEPFHSNLLAVLDLLSDTGVPVVLIPGNHDVWKTRELSSKELFLNQIPQACEERGIHYLEEENLIFEEVSLSIVGSMLWYDLESYRTELTEGLSLKEMLKWKRRLSKDSRYIDWRCSDKEFSDLLLRDLEVRLREAAEVSDRAGNLLFISHIPAFREQIIINHPDRDRSYPISKYELMKYREYHLSKAFYCQPLAGELIRRYAGHFGSVTVVSGHVHVEHRCTVDSGSGGCTIVLHSLGSTYYFPHYITLEY